MARLFTSGAESGAQATEGLTSSGTPPSLTSSAARTGSFGWRSTALASYSILSFTGALARDYFFRGYVRKSGNPASGKLIGLAEHENGVSSHVAVALNSSGQLELKRYDGTTVTTVATSGALTNNVWYRVELEWRVNSGASDDSCALYLDGSLVGSASSVSISTVAPAAMVWGQYDYGATTPTAVTVDWDDVAFNDSTGAAQNTRAGDGHVVNLVPASDSAVGSGWLKPGGASTGLSTSVDNEPPVGIAHSTSAGDAEKQIYKATNGTQNYDANVTTYTAAGITADGTVNLIQAVTNTGSSSATDTSGLLQIVSNPAGDAGTSFVFDNGIAGTFPTNWRTTTNVVQYAPTVTKGTAPVLRVQKTTSTTRVALVDYMAIIVDYTTVAARSASLDASASIATVGARILLRSAALGATAAIATAGEVEAGTQTVERAASLSATADIQATGVFWSTLERSSALNATAAIATVGVRIGVYARSADLSASTAIAAAPQRDLHRAASLTATASVSASGEVVHVFERQASLSATAAITSAPQRDLLRQADLSATGDINATGAVEGGAVTHERAASLDATASVTTAPQRDLQRSAALGATTGIESSGISDSTVERSASLSAATSIVTAGQRDLQRSASLSAATSITAIGQRDLQRSALLSATGAVASAPQRDLNRSASLDATTSIEAASEAEGVVSRSAALSAASSIEVAGETVFERSAALSATGAVASTGQRELLRAVSLTATGVINATPESAEWTYNADQEWTYDADQAWQYTAETTFTYGG